VFSFSQVTLHVYNRNLLQFLLIICKRCNKLFYDVYKTRLKQGDIRFSATSINVLTMIIQLLLIIRFVRL